MASLSLEAPRLRQNGARLAIQLVGTIAIMGLLACGTRIVLAATADATYLVPSGRRTGYPSWMRGPLAGHSTALHLHALLLLMGAMVVAWVGVLVCSPRLPSWSIAATVVAATAIFTLAPPLLSTDVFNYIAYGQMGTSGINPYSHGAAALIGQPIYPYTGHLWKHTASAYGPVFTLLTYALWQTGVAGSLWALKALSGAALLLLAGLVWASARRLGRDPRFAVVLVCLNPLVLVYALGGAHNDLLMVAVLAGAVYLVLAARPAAAGAAAVAAIAIKASAGLALPFILLAARPRKRALAGAVGAAAVIAAGSVALFGTAITKMAGALGEQQRFHWIVVSVPGFVGHYAGLGVPGAAARQWLTAIAVGVTIALIVRARGGRGWIEGAAAATLLLLVTTAWVLPWYIVWALPFAALVRGNAIRAAAVIVTVLLMAMQVDHFVLTHGSHHTHAAHVHARRAIDARRSS